MIHCMHPKQLTRYWTSHSSSQTILPSKEHSYSPNLCQGICICISFIESSSQRLNRIAGKNGHFLASRKGGSTYMQINLYASIYGTYLLNSESTTASFARDHHPYVLTYSFYNLHVGVFAGKTVWSTPERLRGEILTTRRYTNLRLPLPLLWNM